MRLIKILPLLLLLAACAPLTPDGSAPPVSGEAATVAGEPASVETTTDPGIVTTLAGLPKISDIKLLKAFDPVESSTLEKDILKQWKEVILSK